MSRPTMTDAGPALSKLAPLLGAWDVELRWPDQPGGMTAGRASFEWLEDGSYLLYRLGDRAAGSPVATWIIGGDDSAESFTALYADDRRVSRVYQMRLEEKDWTIWRNAPDFSQRFTGTLSEDGTAIDARWERSIDGTGWEMDFYMTYRKVA